jgi:RHS repeat-associated protein
LGWQLSIPLITRKTEKGLPRYTDEDVFVLSGAEDLVVCVEQLPPEYTPPGYTVTRFRPRTEGLFARIEKWVRHSDGDTHWCATTKDNVTSLYGKSESARVADPEKRQHVYQWLLEESFDSKGNHILYEYVKESLEQSSDAIFEQNRGYNQTYIRRILYGNTPDNLSDVKRVGQVRTVTHHRDPDHRFTRHYVFEVLFDYGDLPEIPSISYPFTEPDITIPDTYPVREDRFSNFRAGFEVRTLRRCKRVLMLHHFNEGELAGAPLVKTTDFSYDSDPATKLSFLTAVKVIGYRKGHDDSYVSAEMPPIEFTYSKFEPQKQRYQSVTGEDNDLPPRSLSDPNFALVDLFGDALPDILRTSDSGYDLWQNMGSAHIDRRHPQHGDIPPVTLSQPHVAFGDMGGDGLPDLIVDSPPVSGFFEATPDGQWQSFKRFSRFPSFDLADPNLRLIDLTGDGLSDILLTQDHRFLWCQCLGEEGYAEPESIARIHDLNEFPDIYFGDPAGRVRLADMTGDGLNDIILIHDGRIDYWPNLGYGRFGRRITMADAPRIGYTFDPKRLFLVDLDGSGCADLVYVESSSVHFWFNQSGNSWSEKQTIHGTPDITDLTAIQFADFFGTGTSTLVWSYDYALQPRGNYKVLDFCGGQKPYLITEMSNNLGATTRIQYAPSTKFYLEDRAKNQPWFTTLPFPVQVVEKVEVIDHIGRTKLVTTYKYHHGYYDGKEREFRGFGRVDQFDTEIFEDFAGPGLHGQAVAFDNQDRAHHLPPVETRTWFHTGIYFDPDRHIDHRELTRKYKAEYYSGDPQAFELTDHEFERADGSAGVGLAPHEAYRVLRGALLRTEIYARDGTDRDVHPYIVTDNRYIIKEIQEASGIEHGVYFTIQSEGLNCHYERNPEDPRISHQLTLEVDAFGNVTRSAAVGYPRRSPEYDEQGQTRITCSEADFINVTNEKNWYRIGVPCETRAYELTGVTGGDSSHLLTLQNLRDDAENAVQVSYEVEPASSSLQKRLLDATHTLYWQDDLSGPLPFGEVGLLSLSYESYQMALTQGLIVDVYGSRVDERLLTEEGKYVRGHDIHASGDMLDDAWWIRSGRQRFSEPDFFLPVEFTDPFENTLHTDYDDYCLLVNETLDPLENIIFAENDYRTMQPWQVTDPNGNRVDVAFDAMGMVVGTAVMGKEDENFGDSLEGFEPDMDWDRIAQHIANPLTDPHDILGSATTRMVYDLFAYQRTCDDPWPQPATVYTLARETHAADLTAGTQATIQHSFSYSDGFSREIQKKIQAEPGDVDGIPTNPRWVGNSWTIFNNKGKPVRQYEPFFSATHTFEFARIVGVSPVLFYDPVGRMVATLHANHTYEKVVYDPWKQETWDVNDTVLQSDPKNDPDAGSFFSLLYDDDYLPTWHESRKNGELGVEEQEAAEKAAAHANTPTIAHFDTLGHPFLTIAHNKLEREGATIEYTTRVNLDIEGNQREVIDAQDRIVMHYDYDMLGNNIHQASIEAGERWMLNDVGSSPIRAWDSRKHVLTTEYDALRRPTQMFVEGTDSVHSDPRTVGNRILYEKVVYGEDYADGREAAAELNLLTRAWKQFDSAGVVTSEAFDFKGNLLNGNRRLVKDYKAIPDWDTLPEDRPDDWEDELFQSSTRYDALNRPIQLVAPHAGSETDVIQPGYNEANLLERLEVWLKHTGEPAELLTPDTADQHFVTNIDYNARGQRTLIQYGNGVQTTYEYDDLTFRLAHLQTLRRTEHLQDLSYIYDPSGNITFIRDDAQQTIYFNGEVVKPDAKYTYDALYRLIEACGREHIGQASEPQASWHDRHRINLAHPNEGQAMRNYFEFYKYDEVGNILEFDHKAKRGNWIRAYEYNEPSLIELEKNSNRLSRTVVHPNGQDPISEPYTHDKHGNMTSMPHLPEMAWDFKDQLQMADKGGGCMAYYVYDVGGQRVRKVIEQNGRRMKERFYLGGFEVYRKYNAVEGTIMLERETLHVMDDQQRIALVETRTQGDDDSLPQLIRYQFGNHLGSASLELDDAAQIISYEEYYPYGSTSYQAVRNQTETPKRYRYTGMERDEETGLNYHGARYYAVWLGRWCSCDPELLMDGTNAYSYCGNNPAVFTDKSGKCLCTPECPCEIVMPPTPEPSIEATATEPTPEVIRLPSISIIGDPGTRTFSEWQRFHLPTIERVLAAPIGAMVGFVDYFFAGKYSGDILPFFLGEEALDEIGRVSTYESSRYVGIAAGAVVGIWIVPQRLAAISTFRGRGIRRAVPYLQRFIRQETLNLEELRLGYSLFSATFRTWRIRGIIASYTSSYLLGDVQGAVESGIVDVVEEEFGDYPALTVRRFISLHHIADPVTDPLRSHIESRGLHLSEDVIEQSFPSTREFLEENMREQREVPIPSVPEEGYRLH